MRPDLFAAIRTKCLSSIKTLIAISSLSVLLLMGSCTVTTHDPLHVAEFSNSNLKGNYVYTLGGITASPTGGVAYQQSGVFIADGDGHISGGTDDFVQSGGAASGPVTGSYMIAGDGTGTMALNGVREIHLAITMVSASKLYLIEYDGAGNGAGAAVQQNLSATPASPQGTYVFHCHSSNFDRGFPFSAASVGRLNFTGGLISGDADVLHAGVFSSTTMNGSFTASDNQGRGTAALTDGSGLTATYVYYLIDSNTMNLLETDLANLGGGHAEVQNGSSFSKASLTGGFSFRSQGDTVTHNSGANSAGTLSSDGNGNIDGGSYDSVQDGIALTNASLSGGYSIDERGRATINLTPQGTTPVLQIAWLVDSNRAFFLVNSADRVEDGVMDQQTGAPFSAASTKGQYAFYMYGYNQNANVRIDRVGTLVFDDGKATIAFNNYYMNRGGSLNQIGALGVSYTTSAGGRLFSSPSGVSSDLIVYLTSSSSANLLLGDSGIEMSGRVEQQVVP
jgi:hypothetical protein